MRCGSSRIFFCFRFQLSIKLVASKFASASFFKVLPLPQKINRFRFHIPAPYFMKNASASGSSKSQILPSSLPLPASFFKVLLLPQKFNRFQLPLPHPCSSQIYCVMQLFRSVVSAQLSSDRQTPVCYANCHNYLKKMRAG